MNTDRELLELAAKASGRAGWKFSEEISTAHAAVWEAPDGSYRGWSPHRRDDDSRQLAVALNFTVAHRDHECEVFDDEGQCLSSVAIFTASAVVRPEQATDPCAAARLSVLLAAAAVGSRQTHKPSTC